MNGPVYSEVVKGKDLIADILPPPEYIIESYLISLELAASNKSGMVALIEQFNSLRKEFFSRHEYWKNTPLPDNIRQGLVQESFDFGVDFYKIGLDEFIPALQKGDQDTAESALKRMKTAYENHRVAINKVVANTNLYLNSIEEGAAETISHATKVMMTILFVAIAVNLLISFLIVRSIIYPLKLVQGTIAEIEGTGDYSYRVDYQSADEAGQMACAFNSMMASLQDALSNTNQVMGAVARGDFSRRVSVEARGDLAQLKSSVNGSVDKLELTMTALTDVMKALREGNFDKRVDAKVDG
ncbi:MAG: HAMP domain-containing protein, partial [Gallionella sp.]|nr:HAMP domain-containing protein [Gallionella sp.]